MQTRTSTEFSSGSCAHSDTTFYGWWSRAPGTGDTQIIGLARAEQRVVLTFDRDFGELVFHQGHSVPGVIFLRLDTRSPDELLRVFRDIWPRLEATADGHFIVVRADKIRIRPLTPRPAN